MNKFLNENWKELIRELETPIGEGLGQVVNVILSNIFELVPYDEGFPFTV